MCSEAVTSDTASHIFSMCNSCKLEDRKELSWVKANMLDFNDFVKQGSVAYTALFAGGRIF